MTEPVSSLRSRAAKAAGVCIGANIRRATRAATQLFDAILQPSGLKSTQLTLLMAVATVERVPLTRLAEGMGMDRTTLTRNLKPLEAQGFIRIESGDDRRRRVITLTDPGRRALERALPLWEQAQARIIKGLGRRRWEELHDALSGLVALLRDRQVSHKDAPSPQADSAGPGPGKEDNAARRRAESLPKRGRRSLIPR